MKKIIALNCALKSKHLFKVDVLTGRKMGEVCYSFNSQQVQLISSQQKTSQVGVYILQQLSTQIAIVHCKKSSYTKFTYPCCMLSRLLKKSVNARNFTQQAT